MPAYEIARKMGLRVVGSDMNPAAPGFKLADDRIIASTYDAQETLEKVIEFTREKRIDGVMTLASDVPMTVAMVSDKLNLPGVAIETARISSNKLFQLEAFQKNNVPVPPYREIVSVSQLKEMIVEWGFPVIVKPPDNRGSRGVLRITPDTDIEWAFRMSLSQSNTGSIIVQPFIPGRQISSESLVVNGRCYTAMFSSRNYEFLDRYAPYIIENGGGLPATLTEIESHQLDEVIQRVADALHIENGPLKGDLVMTDEGPMVLEATARMGGGYAVSHSIPLTTGINLVEQVIRMALGETIDREQLISKKIQTAALRFFFPAPGLIKAIHGFDALDKCPWIVLKQMYRGVGDLVDRVTDHTKRTGCVIAIGKDRAEADERACKAIESVQIVTQPN